MNPDPVARLIGRKNEGPIILEDKPLTALIDSGASVTTITEDCCQDLGLQIKPLGDLLHVEGTSGYTVPYKGYVEANLQIPKVDQYNEDILLLVLPSNPYGRKVPVQIGTRVIDRVLQLVPDGEIIEAHEAWRRAQASVALMAGMVQVGEQPPGKRFRLEDAEGPVAASKAIIVPPFETIKVQGITKIRGHVKGVHVMTEAPEKEYSNSVLTTRAYTELKAGSTRVGVCLRNMTPRTVKIPAKTVIGRVCAANIMLPPELPKGTVRQGATLETEETENVVNQIDFEGIATWTEKDQQDAHSLMRKYAHCFSSHDLDLGRTSLIEHEIRVTDPIPFKERYRRIPPGLYDEVRAHLKEMLDIGAIRPSQSPWASAVVLVRKKDGKLRFCIDLRKLNNRTVKDSYSLPRIEDTLDCLNGAVWFSSLDLKSGYWQVEMSEESKPLTAFTVGPLGFFECNRMPFGLTNAPATFQRLMETCLSELHLSWCIIYLDDIIVFSSTPAEHLERLEAVFKRLEAAGLKLKPSKCEFFKRSLVYLGHVVSERGIETDPKKIKVIEDWPRPKTVTDVRSFLGFTNYYRKFIRQYAQTAKPLYLLISGDNASRKNKPVEWDEDCERAFTQLKGLCTESPILAYADFTKPFKLHTDACGLGLGAILYQESEGKDRVISYASRSLSKSEAKYPAHKLEFLALKWAVTDQFHEYLYANKFDVYTDNNPLTYVLTSAKLDATGHRWIASLANYNFSIHYKSGKTNVDADALSRIPWDRDVDIEGVQALIQGITARPQVLYEATSCSLRACEELQVETKPGNMTLEQWVEAQNEDPTIGQIRSLFQSHSLGNYKLQPNDSEELRLYLKQRGRFKMRKNILYRKIQTTRMDRSPLQLVLPTTYRKIALQGCHNDVGHLGIERMLDLLRDRFYWPNMQADAEQHVKTCERCLRFKAKPEKAELQPLTATHPLELVHMDYLTIESRTGGADVNILVITDHFTRYAQALVTSSQTARVTAQALWERFIVHYGLPEKLISDQGRNFESELVQELCRLAQVKKLRTTPYHPMTNGQCERFNATLIGMLGTLSEHSKAHWSNLVPTLVHAYNCTRNNSTGFSPYFLMYGRKPKLPLDLYFGLQTDRCASPSTKFVQQLKSRLQWAYGTAQRMSAQESKRHKRRYDRRAKCSKIEQGDIVLVRRKAFTGKHKIADRWESATYEVVKQLAPGMPVFRVKSQDGSERTRVVHRNLLLPLQQDPDMELNTQEGMDPIVENAPQVEFNSDEDDSQQVPIATPRETVEVPEQEEDVEVFTGPRTRSRGLVAAAIVSTGGQIRRVMRSGSDHLSHWLGLH